MTVEIDAEKQGSTTLEYDITVIIQVNDVLEPPAAPAVTVELNDTTPTTKIDVSWTAPDMTGKPDISGYDLEYRQHGDDDWTDTNFSGTGTSKTLTGLTAGKSYEVQVRAVNDEGDGAWGTSSVITKADGITLSVDENSAVGSKIGKPVTATSNPNNYDLAHSLSGTNADKFDIGLNDGQIKVGTGTTLDYESGTTSYSVIVTVKASAGGVQAQSLSLEPNNPGNYLVPVTINVTDVEGAPGQARRPDGDFDGQLRQHHAAREVDCARHDGQAARHGLRRALPEEGRFNLEVPLVHGHRNLDQDHGPGGRRQLQRTDTGHE